ncbi:MAG: 2Fe-2S iron-sulfur cluster-binding protein [Burkholderiales bacterium]
MNIVIDDRTIEARDGETVLEAALRHGIDIPHFCYHDQLSVAGSCRMCLVKVNNLPKLQPACNVVVAPKMTVETNAAPVQEARRNVLQFILRNHPVDCGICDKAGECRLQDYQHRYGGVEAASREPKQEQRKLHELSPRILLDNERCILCSRCVRFTREISKSNQLGIVERGHHSYVEALDGQPFTDPYSDNVIDLCPVGALLHRDFLYECRVWFLQPVRSVCTGCARGCAVKVWRRKKERELRMPGVDHRQEAYRVSAQDTPGAGGPWLCNKGFDLHHRMARERLAGARVDGAAAAPEAALDAAQRLLAAARKPAVVVSAHASNEELDACRAAFGDRVAWYAHADCVPAPGEVVADEFLIRADKNPNRRGVEVRFGWREIDPAASHDVVLVWGELAAPLPLGNARWIHLTPFGTPDLDAAAVAIPIATLFERAGSFTNCEGVDHAFDPVFDKPAHVQHAADVFARIAP